MYWARGILYVHIWDIGKATHPPMRSLKPPPASALTSPVTLLIFPCFIPGDSVNSVTLGDEDGYHPTNHKHVYFFSNPHPRRLCHLKLVSPRPAPVYFVQPYRCKTSIELYGYPTEVRSSLSIDLETQLTTTLRFLQPLPTY